MTPRNSTKKIRFIIPTTFKTKEYEKAINFFKPDHSIQSIAFLYYLIMLIITRLYLQQNKTINIIKLII